MRNIYSTRERSPSQVQDIGIVISKPDGYHLGILYSDQRRGGARILHLAGHTVLRNDLPTEDMLWVQPIILRARARSIAGYCRRIWRQNNIGGVPYAFSFPKDFFDTHTGKLRLSTSKVGLTCATFVLNVFSDEGIEFIDYSSWKPRDRDVEWQKSIIELLEKKGASASHIELVKTEIGNIRIRPEEAIGCAALAPPPIKFEIAIRAGKYVVQKIKTNAKRMKRM